MDTTQLRERWLQLKPQVDRVAKEMALLRRTTERLASEEGYQALRKLHKEIQIMEALSLESHGLVDEVKDALGPVKDWLDAEWTRRSTEFAEELHAFFRDREVILQGVPPVLEAQSVAIEFDTRQDKARLLYAGESVKEGIPLAPVQIFRAWQQACQQLERGSTPPAELHAALLEAYGEVCVSRGLRPGGRVRLPEVHFQLFVARQTAQVRQDPRKGRIKEYPRYQFAYDLACLLDSPEGMNRGGRILTLHVAARSAADSRSASIRLPDGRGGWTFYSDLQVE